MDRRRSGPEAAPWPGLWLETFRMTQGTEIYLLCQVFDGAVIVLSVAPMVASTVANRPRSPWDAISLIIVLRIWRVKRVIDGEWPERGWQG